MKSAASEALLSLHRGLLATLQRRLPPEQSSEPLVELLRALTLALGRGDISLALHDGSEVPEGIESDGWPRVHREALLASGWLDGDQSILVLHHNTLSWRRWHGAMQELERELQRRCFQAPIHATPHSATSSQLAKNNDLSSEQRSAVRAIDHYGVVLLSGGPGTGKTSTVLHMLLRALEHQPKLRARLAAPTGKAARRLQDAIRSHPKTASLPCTTLHRLLEARMGKKGKREYVQVLRLLETFEMIHVHGAVRQALDLGAIGYDAVKHLVLCRIERRPPRLDLDPYLLISAEK